MTKNLYQAPEAELAAAMEQNLICQSLTTGISDYDLVEGYEWEE